ncbi:acyl transferase/acyl hydrolase/lysophospholipase [Xylaria cubensis]|nr:acyl transferase/acyl hydrolase/lysophospholipase [Xylaria cubensis]
MDDHAVIPSPTTHPHAGRGPWAQKIALSLDGGGIRGYWSLLVLGELMKLIKVEEESRHRPARSSFHPYDEPRNVSRISQALETPFLPCHYFDYVGGTSTGALITILLSRFRMTVDDCLQEYETMASSVFGHPKLIYSMKFGVGGNKFHRASLEQAVKKVSERRAEQRTEDYSEFLFQTEIDTCRGIVLAMRVGDRQTNSQPFLFRSYTPFNEGSRQHKARHTGEPKNHLEGSKISLVKVALAATAAPLYFGDYRCTLSAAHMQASERAPTTLGTTISSTQRHASSRNSTARGVTTFSKKRNDMMPADGKSEYEFEDAGFGAVNNPCNELEREIMHHHGQVEPILVSIGTARPQPRKQRNRLLRVIRKAFDTAGDPELVHQQMQRPDTVDRYFRFNDEQGIDVEMDDWRPKNNGEHTLEALRNGFREWVLRAEVRKDLMGCAKTLVDFRRARMTTPRWERFALVRSFECRVNMCPKDRDNKWLDREDFRNHLARDHKPEDYKGVTIDEAVERCAREWEYRA